MAQGDLIAEPLEAEKALLYRLRKQETILADSVKLVSGELT